MEQQRLPVWDCGRTLAELCVVALADRFRTGVPLRQSLASREAGGRWWDAELNADAAERVATVLAERDLIDHRRVLGLLVQLPTFSLLRLGALLATANLWPTGVQSVSASRAEVDDEFVERLAASEAAATIQELDLSRTYITDAALRRLLPAFPQLRALNLKACPRVSRLGDRQLCAHGPSLLQSLALDSRLIDDAFLDHLSHPSIPLPYLSELRSCKGRVTVMPLSFDAASRFIRSRGNSHHFTVLQLLLPELCEASGRTRQEALELAVYAVTHAMPNLRAFPFEMYPITLDSSTARGLGIGPLLTQARMHRPVVCREIDDRAIQLLSQHPATRVATASGPASSSGRWATKEDLDRMLRCLPGLTDLTAFPAPSCLLDEITRLTGLTRLQIGELTLTRDALDQLGQLHGLERLQLAYVKAQWGHEPADTARALEECIAGMASLRYLDITNFEIVSRSCYPPQSPPPPVRGTIRHPRLTTLELESSSINERVLCFAAIACPRLTRCVAYGQADLDLADVVRACPRVQKCILDLCDASVDDFFGHVARGWSRLRTLSLSRGSVRPLRADAPALPPLPLARLERLKLLWCNIDTATLEAAVNGAPRLCALELRELSAVTSLENLASKSLRSVEIDTLRALRGRLAIAGCPNVCRFHLVGQHGLREVVLEGKRELEELNLNLSPTVGRLVVRDNPRLRDLYLFADSPEPAALAATIDSPSLSLLHLGGWHELYAGLMDKTREAGGGGEEYNWMPAVKQLCLSLPPVQAKPEKLDRMRRTIRRLTSLRSLEVEGGEYEDEEESDETQCREVLRIIEHENPGLLAITFDGEVVTAPRSV